MTTKARAFLAAAGALIGYLILVWSLPSLLDIQGGDRWILRGALAVLGVLTAGLSLWYYLQMERQAAGGAAGPAGREGEDDAGALLRAADARLSAAGQGAGVRKLPVVVVLGASGSAKTTLVVRSGLDPELLAGQVYRDDMVVPTSAVNVWYARGVVFVEAGGKLLGDAAAWLRFIKRLQPGRLSAALGRGSQAPRVALVCVDAEDFTRAGAGEALHAAARNLRARLGELAQVLGIHLPVYVVFTRSDRIPFFADYVQNFTEDEAAQVFGATLPLEARAAGLYAEQETRRLDEALRALFGSLAEKRLLFLAREHAEDRRPGVYEFPREFRKVIPLAAQFLVELTKPSQLQVSPLLRGFYFTGVRPVVVQEPTPAAVRPAARRDPERLAATFLFRGPQAEEPAAAPVPEAVSRRVPQWVFVKRLFRDVILGDHAAMGAAAAGVKVNFLRRTLLAAAIIACLVVAVGFTVSFAGNRGLENRALDAARGLGAVSSPGGDLASLADLRRLEALREHLATLAEYRRRGAPWRIRWGLYSGDDLYPEVRRLYFDRFAQLMFRATHAALLDFLQRVPPAAGQDDDYGLAYNTLKAYLITSSHPDKSTPEFLTPVLMRYWLGGRTLDAERAQFAQKQFDFYAAELPFGNPYTLAPNTAAVERARRYLATFVGEERVYQYMLAEAAKTNPPVNFNKRYPGSASYVVDPKEVPGAFTKGGWTFVQNALKDAERFFSGEAWVVGEQGAIQISRAELERRIRERYTAEFVEHWRAYLRSAAVLRYADIKDATLKLAALSSNQSPLLALLHLAAANTAVDSPQVAQVFQPVGAVTPPDLTDKFVAPPNAGYINSLVTLQASLAQIPIPMPGLNDPAVRQTQSNAVTAKLAVAQVAQSFRVGADADIGATVQKLLEAPITHLEAVLRPVTPAEVNGAGRSLCAAFRSLLGKYPFHPGASAQATLADVNAVFRPETGVLWTSYEQTFKKILNREGGRFTPKPDAGVAVSPAFVSFFNRAAALSDFLYKEGATEPRFTYTLRALPAEGIQSVTVELDGQAARFTGGGETRQFAWPGTGAREARLSGQFGGPQLTFLGYQGLWATFQLFHQADAWRGSPPVLVVEWGVKIGGQQAMLPNKTPLKVILELNTAGGPPLFQKGYFSELACVPDVAR